MFNFNNVNVNIDRIAGIMMVADNFSVQKYRCNIS